MERLRLFLTTLTLILAYAEGYHQGPPVDTVATVCQDMNPSGHGDTAQSDQAPVTITLGNDCYKEGHEISVTVKDNNANLKGIFVQARKTSETVANNSPSGTFISNGDSQPMKAYTCTATNDAWGHSDRLTSNTATFKWVAPSSNVGSVALVMTIVEKQDTFWTFVQSRTISYSSTCVEKSSGNVTSRMTSLLYLVLSALAIIVARPRL